jgi:N-acetylglutamate synthase-like GNAT family acetyltransferase
MKSSSVDLEFRHAVPGDWPAIETLLLSSGLPLAGAKEQLPNFRVVMSDSQLVACAAVERYGVDGLIRSVAVRQEDRGRGTGDALVRDVIAWATAAGFERLTLLTETAPAFFARLGFQKIDRVDAPVAVTESIEFRGACPASAITMLLPLAPDSA